MLFVMGQYLSVENQQIYLKSKFSFMIILFKFYVLQNYYNNYVYNEFAISTTTGS